MLENRVTSDKPRETILMIHGMSGGEWCWYKYKPYFEDKGYKCITPVLRYHENKDKYDKRLGNTSILDYVSDIENDIKKLDETPILMGHSMGGLIAQILAARGLAKGIVLLTPAWPRGIFTIDFSALRIFWRTVCRSIFSRKPSKLSFRKIVYAMLEDLDDEEKRFVYDNLGYESVRTVFEIGLWFLDYKKATYVDEKKVNCPVLLLGGKWDRITSIKAIRKMAEKYNCTETDVTRRYKEYESQSHWILGGPRCDEICDFIYNEWLIENF